MIADVLQRLLEQNQLVSFDIDYCKNEIVGKVLFHNHEIVVLAAYANDGLYDGCVVFEREDLNELYFGNRALDSIDKLIQRNNLALNVHTFQAVDFKSAVIEMSLYYGLLEIYTGSNRFDVARVIDYDEDWLRFESYGNRSTLSSCESVIRRSTISRIAVDTPYISNLLHLYGELRN